MAFASNGDVRIHYRVEGTGRPLVLLHGAGGSCESWRGSGWSAGLQDHYRLIMIDARGHGMSDKPHVPEAYRMELVVGDVMAVLDDLGVRKSHFLGYSRGGRTCYGIAKYAPERVTSLIIGGAGAEDPDPKHPSESSQRMIEVLRGGREAFFNANRKGVEEESRTAQRPSAVEAWLTRFFAINAESDLQAYIALMMSSQKECLGIPEILPRLTLPCLLYVGEQDGSFLGTKAAAALIPNARFVSFPGVGHIEVTARPELALPVILRFLAEVDQALIP